MTSWKSIRRQFEQTLRGLLPTRHIGWTGWADGTIVDSTRPNFIRITMQDGSETEAWNDGVPANANMQVDLYTDPDYPGLLRARQPRLSFTQDFPYICIQFHRDNHTWPGPDTVPVELRQFMPLHPSVSGFTLTVRAGWFETSAGLVYFDPDTVDLTSNKPASGARYVLVSISADGTLTVTDGTVKTLFTLTTSDIPARPDGHTRVCAVRLYAGQLEIKDQATNTDLLDLRFTGFGLDGQTADWDSITNIPTPITEIAALSPSNDDIIQRKAGAWTNRTMVQLADDVSPHIAYLRPQSSANILYRCDAPGGTSSWSGTISSKSGTDVVYSTTSGTPGALVPQSTSNIAKIILHNTTRGTSALISNCNTGTNTITLTATVPTGWLATDVITINSQTVTGAPIQYVDMQITSEFTEAVGLLLAMNIISGTPGHNMRVHPLNTYGAGKQQTAQAAVAGMNGTFTAFLAITSDRFCLGWNGTPSNVILTVIGESK